MKQADGFETLRVEIEQKRELVARLEQERTDLELEIAAFEVLYNAEVKPIQNELDAVQRHIEEYQARNELVRLWGNRLSPSQLEAEIEMRLGASRAQFIADDIPIHQAPKWQGAAPSPVSDAETKAELRTVYRELAKRFHPDLAANDVEREAHGQRMAEINDAYARGNLEVLRQVASQSGLRAARSAPSTLEALRAERDRLDALIVQLRQDIAALNRDPLMLLKLDVSLARHGGRDLLADMAIELHIQLVERRGRLNKLIAEFRELVEQVGLA